MKKEIKTERIMIRISAQLKKILAKKNIDIAETCRQALQKAAEEK